MTDGFDKKRCKGDWLAKFALHDTSTRTEFQLSSTISELLQTNIIDSKSPSLNRCRDKGSKKDFYIEVKMEDRFDCFSEEGSEFYSNPNLRDQFSQLQLQFSVKKELATITTWKWK